MLPEVDGDLNIRVVLATDPMNRQESGGLRKKKKNQLCRQEYKVDILTLLNLSVRHFQNSFPPNVRQSTDQLLTSTPLYAEEDAQTNLV